MNERERQWQIFVRNRETAIEALRPGECDGIIPAARGFLDGFAGFLHEWGMLPLFDTFLDHRERRSIAVFSFCHTLLYRPLFQLPRLANIADTLFQSPYIISCASWVSMPDRLMWASMPTSLTASAWVKAASGRVAQVATRPPRRGRHRCPHRKSQ